VQKGNKAGDLIQNSENPKIAAFGPAHVNKYHDENFKKVYGDISC
jgi:hypothetical protein